MQSYKTTGMQILNKQTNKVNGNVHPLASNVRMKRSDNVLPWLAKKAEKIVTDIKKREIPLKAKNIDI
jgi:hypothetical protein